MSNNKKRKNQPSGVAESVNPRLDPEQRLADRFDSASIANYPVADPKKMGFRVVDNAVEEHMM